MEEFRKDFTAQATERVKSQLVIEGIIEREEITATDEDVEARVAEMAKAQGKEVPDVKKNTLPIISTLRRMKIFPSASPAASSLLMFPSSSLMAMS